MKRILIATCIALTVIGTVTAQQDPIAILEFFDDESTLAIVDEDGFEVNFYMGMGLSPGDRIVTTTGSVEVRLEPNGSIFFIGPNTEWSLDSLDGRDGADTNRFAVQRGRVRMVAAQFAERVSRYEIRTPSAVAGVRGTDFGVVVDVPDPDTTPPAEVEPLQSDDSPPEQSQVENDGQSQDQTPIQDQPEVPGEPQTREELFVFNGEVILTNTITEESVFVSSGQLVDITSPEFLPQELEAADIAERIEGLRFQRLDPQAVPGIAIEEEPEIVEVEPTPPPQPETVPEPEEPGVLDRVFSTIAGASGLGVGSVTLNQETYARVTLQPRISFGKLDAALYLPIVYRENLFDPEDWYQPEGNHEWSFGSDQDWSNEPLIALRDLGTDLALKIRYIQYADRGDPFFLKVGNLSNFTVGQGLLMRNYANDIDFPVVRRVGFNTGVDLTKWGLEVMTNDLTAPEINGGRIYFRPAAPMIPAAVGISAITDIAPADDISFTDRSGDPLDAEIVEVLRATQTGDPLFLNVGMDLEVPIIDREIFSLIGFAEGGGLIPYLREKTEYGGETLKAGLKTSALVDFSSGELKNFGWSAGARGHASIFTFRAEFRSYDGLFRPAFYGPSYDRLRGNYAAETLLYLANTEAEEYQIRTMGIAGEAGVDILDLLFLNAGYFQPWEVDEDGDYSGSNDDEFNVGLAFRDGLIPFGITAGAEYRRTHFAATINGWGDYDDAHLFDAYTTLDAYVRYPLTEVIDLEAQISTAVIRNEEGEIVYNDDGAPQVAPVLAIRTRIGF